MSTAVVSRWARRFLLGSATFLVASQVAILLGAPRGVEVVLGLYGFVLTTVFGKAYSLIPSYFDRELAWPLAPMAQLPLVIAGVASLTLANWSVGPPELDVLGRLLWAGGVAVFLVTMVLTVRTNLTGAETATGDASADRQPMDRLANVFVPVALGYLVLGTYEFGGDALGLPTLFDGLSVPISHLLGPGFALLLLFAVGFRLLPRFLVTTPPRPLAAVTLGAGALGPACLALGYPVGPLFRAGAVLETIAVAGFALSCLWLFAATDRDRIGFYGPLAGVCLGLFGVGLGAYFAFESLAIALVRVHVRLNVFGLLGLSIVGVVYQFYPPALAEWPFASDRLAMGTLWTLAGGLALSALAPLSSPVLGAAGQSLALAGSVGYLYLLAGTIIYQTVSHR